MSLTISKKLLVIEKVTDSKNYSIFYAFMVGTQNIKSKQRSLFLVSVISACRLDKNSDDCS